MSARHVDTSSSTAGSFRRETSRPDGGLQTSSTLWPSERERLLRAAAEVFAEGGYSDVSVAGIVARARVPQMSFGMHFDSKADCMLTAHQEAFEQLRQALTTSCRSQPTWPDSLTAAITAAVDFAFEFPSKAYLLAFAWAADEPQLSDRGQFVHEYLLDLLRSSRQASDDGNNRPQPTERALVLGAIELVSVESRSGSIDRAHSLASELIQIFLSPSLGAA